MINHSISDQCQSVSISSISETSSRTKRFAYLLLSILSGQQVVPSHSFHILQEDKISVILPWTPLSPTLLTKIKPYITDPNLHGPEALMSFLWSPLSPDCLIRISRSCLVVNTPDVMKTVFGFIVIGNALCHSNTPLTHLFFHRGQVPNLCGHYPTGKVFVMFRRQIEHKISG